METLKPKVPVKRMVFHEITQPAIQAAVANPREIDRDLVDAQEARRILDRLYGYEVSPVLWKKVHAEALGRPGAVGGDPDRGRAGAAADGVPHRRILGHPGHPRRRRRSRRGAAHVHTPPWSRSDGDRIATGKDFEPTTGGSSPAPAWCTSTGTAPAGLAARLDGRPFTVTRVEEKPYRRRPYAPFITSTLQQEAARKLRLSSQQTMRIAQRLYENGYITYMRTDSVNLSETAIAAARRQIAELYGDAVVPPEPRRYTGKVKNAQEAHEAIRPAGDNFRTPGEVAKELSAEEFRLYELIWRRTIASQMTDAVGSSVSVRIRAVSTAGEEADFGATGKTITDPGFLRAYVESSDDENAEAEDAERRLPNLVKDQPLTADAADRGRAHHPAAGPLHRGVAGQGAGGAGHRPPVDVRVDHADHPGPRVRLQARPGADPVVPGVRRGRAAGAALPAAGRLRLHRLDGERAGRDRRRRRSAPSTSSPRSTSAATDGDRRLGRARRAG